MQHAKEGSCLSEVTGACAQAQRIIYVHLDPSLQGQAQSCGAQSCQLLAENDRVKRKRETVGDYIGATVGSIPSSSRN